MIPQMLLKRVDVVTGGASAVYGSDAVAGVINFVTDTRFTGVKTQVQGGVSTYGDDRPRTSALPRHRPVRRARPRDRQLPVPRRSGRSVPHRPAVGYPPVDRAGWRHRLRIRIAWPTTRASRPPPSAAWCATGPLVASTLRRTACSAPRARRAHRQCHLRERWRRRLQQRLDPRRDEIAPGLRPHGLEFSDSVHGYVEGSFTENRTQNFGAYNALLNGVTLSATNPFLAQTYQNQLAAANATTFNVSRVFADAPRINTDGKSDQYFFNAGLNGELGGGWKWNVSGTDAQAKLATRNDNNWNNQRVAAALDAVVNPATGQIVCRASLTNSAYANCVPAEHPRPERAEPGGARLHHAGHVLRREEHAQRIRRLRFPVRRSRPGRARSTSP
jgi:iron complex outermembrane receptor protein